jgi:hypothetical protein
MLRVSLIPVVLTAAGLPVIADVLGVVSVPVVAFVPDVAAAAFLLLLLASLRLRPSFRQVFLHTVLYNETHIRLPVSDYQQQGDFLIFLCM